jgi:hypothetical protein
MTDFSLSHTYFLKHLKYQVQSKAGTASVTSFKEAVPCSSKILCLELWRGIFAGGNASKTRDLPSICYSNKNMASKLKTIVIINFHCSCSCYQFFYKQRQP